jgi:polar amino acid transport system substrate-binding protein
MAATLGALVIALTSQVHAAEPIKKLHDAVPEQYQKDGINVAVFNDWPPDEFVENGELKGWSVDFAKEISARLGVEFKFIPTSFDAIIPGLASKRFDAGFSSFGATAERLEVLDFVAQRKEGTAYASKKGRNLVVNEEKDLCGHSISIINGSWDYQNLQKINERSCVAAKLKPIDLQQFSNEANAELAVSSGRVDFVAAGSAKLRYLAKQTGTYDVSNLVSNAVYSCIGVRKGDALGPVLRDAIQSMIDDGTYKTILAKWGVDGSGTIDKSLVINKDNFQP